MLNQFHDVLPGTTISLVIDDVMEIYTRRSSQARELIEAALRVVYSETSAVESPEVGTAAIDPLRLERQQVVSTSDGFAVAHTNDLGVGKVEAAPNTISSPSARVSGSEAQLENDHFKLIISEGRITSLVDKRLERELILAGPGSPNGGLVLYEDYPLRYDAWDAEVYHLDTYTLLTFDELVAEEAPLRASIVATAKFGKSVAKLTVSGSRLGAVKNADDSSRSMPCGPARQIALSAWMPI